MRAFLGFLVLLLLPILGKGQADSMLNYATVDAHVDSLELVGNDVDRITQHITFPFRSELEKVRAIYRYLTTHLSYDQEAYRDGERRINRNVTDVLQRGKAVCWGYATTFKAMCDAAGINSYVISGYARDAPIPSSAYENSNHVWNAVQIEGKWHLLDATWGSTLLRADTYFSIEDGIDYFLPNPDLLIHSHFPLMKMWQLKRCPTKYEDFIAYKFDQDESQCEYNFPVHIDYFLRLDFYTQQVTIMREAYDINPSISNRRQIGHALIDVAVRNKERGDLHLEMDSVALAIEEFEAATKIFDLALSYVDLYPWQSQSMVFGWANLAQALHRREAKELRSAERIAVVINRLDTLLDQEQDVLPVTTLNQLQQLVIDLTPVSE